MSSKSNIPHYKTLDIIKFYNQVYDFVSRYLIFVFAGISASLAVLIIRIWEPQTDFLIYQNNKAPQSSQGYVQKSDLIYPMYYFAESPITFTGNNTIFGLGGPIRLSQGAWNSIDNIIQYNGIILPRQIGGNAWVPNLQQQDYTKSMIQMLLTGMANSSVTIESIEAALDNIEKEEPSASLSSIFGIGCINKPLFTTKFCDLKLGDAMNLRDKYDLSNSLDELTDIYHYIFQKSRNIAIQEAWCKAMIKQYRYSASPGLTTVLKGCNTTITHEANYIADMVAINKEVSSHTYSSKIYTNPIMNRYKLMSLYQYLMGRIQSNQFVSGEDDEILRMYDSYITKLVYANAITQPYGDIITIFHQDYLLPRLVGRNSFANSDEKELTKQISRTTSLILMGDTSQNAAPITSGSKLIITQSGDNGSESEPEIDTGSIDITPAITPVETGATTEGVNAVTTTADTSTPPKAGIQELIAQVLGTTPTSVVKKNQLIVISYGYQGLDWIITVDMANKGNSQLYYNSPISGATKITHPQVTFSTSNRELILAIMSDYSKTTLKQ